MIRVLFILFFMLSLDVQAQDNYKYSIYLNENSEPIDKYEFYEKSLSQIYNQRKKELDSVVINRLEQRYNFGAFDTTEFSQVKILLKKHLNIETIDKPLILVFRDSLLGHPELLKSRDARVTFDEGHVPKFKTYSNRRIKYDKDQKKCQKFAKKNNSTPYYLFTENENYTYTPKHYNNYKISRALKSIFLNHEKAGIVILKPNGQYFFYKYISQKQVKRMLHTNWNNYITDFEKVKKNLNIYQLDFIQDMLTERNTDAIRQYQQGKNNGVVPNKYNIGRTTRRVSVKFPNCYTYASY